MSENEQPAEASGTHEVRLDRIYLKDASFESPATPAVFGERWEPQVNLDINTRSQRGGENHYEVVLTVTATAKLGERTAFIAEVQQAGVFSLAEGLAEDVVQRTIGAFCPTTLFPYVREALDSLVVRGGFPALNLAPVNFDAAYAQALEQQRQSPTH